MASEDGILLVIEFLYLEQRKLNIWWKNIYIYIYINSITSNIHACTPSSITHLDVYTKTIYKSVVFCAIGEVFATGWFTFNYRQRYQEKITLYLPRAMAILFPLSSFWNTNYQYQYLRKRAVFKLKKIEIRKNMTESEEKPLFSFQIFY